MTDMFSKIAIMLCVAGGLAAGHSLIKPKFPLLLNGDAPAVPAQPTANGPTQPPANPTNDTTPDKGQTQAAQVTTPTPPAQPAADDTNISIGAAFEFFNQGKPFIDARHIDEFEKGHVRNAYQLSADELLAGKGMTWVGALDKSDVVVIYCGGGECDASHNLMRYLQTSFGFTKCRIMTDGWPGWQSAGHPGDTGAPNIGNDQ